MGKKKISLIIDKENLERICKKSGTNTTYTIKRALNAYEFLLDNTSQGKDIVIKDKKGKEIYYKII